LKSYKLTNDTLDKTRPCLRTESELAAVRKLANKVKRQNGRFEFYNYLTGVYRLNRRWRHSGLDNTTARRVARQLALPWRKDTSAIRIIIEATFPIATSKQKSRWVRALQFAAEENTRSKELKELFRSKGGVAGCAQAAARRDPRRETLRDDWA
jgi:hypothetical protein